MKKIFINFANDKFKRQQEFALKMAKLFGNFDKIIGYGPEDIDADFFKKNEEILKVERGAGLWLWKPYFILKTLNEAKEGDYVFYLDSGFFMIKKIDLLIDSLAKSNQDIMSFQTYYPEFQWTKKSLFESMDCMEDKHKEINQFVGGICLIKNTAFSRSFFEKFVSYASQYENISDTNESDEQDEKFIEHRHDQSVYSLLCKKEGLKPFRTPFVFGELGAAYAVMKKTEQAYGKEMNFNFTDFENSNYPSMLHINKEFVMFGVKINLFFISYLYLRLLNAITFKSRLYNALLKLGVKSQKA
ncbi:MAG: hypothetical protein ACD_9C00151G0002 [uncultured bacterium]|nr:MAG: hypothetical protein ACD_9C00151G0002 [uncultured bacterium]